MVSKAQYTAETIQCYPINVELLSLGVDELLHRSNPNPNITYRVVHPLALIREPRLAVISEEFIGGDIENSVTFGIHESEKMPNGLSRHNCVAEKEITLTLVELELYLDKPVTLAEFTKARRGYNSRIRGNEALWMRYFNE